MTSWDRQPHTHLCYYTSAHKGMSQHAADSTNGFLGTAATGLHDTPALCVCVRARVCVIVLRRLSQRGAGIHDVTAGSGQAVWWNRHGDVISLFVCLPFTTT